MVKRSRLLTVFVSLTVAAVAEPASGASFTVRPWRKLLAAYLSSVQNPATGLLESFSASRDPALSRIAFTYDVAVSALVLAHQGQLDASASALSLYRDMDMPGTWPGVFNTAYHTERRTPTLEYACHGGPVFWTAISLIRLGERAHDPDAIAQGVRLMEWAAASLPHYQGGVAMGTEEPWSVLTSVENNWVYYAALRVALPHVPQGPRREALSREKLSVRRWLAGHWRNRSDGDPVKALDVYTHALLVGPRAHLEDAMMDPAALSAWAKSWIEELETLFRVPGTNRYDYTDALEARQVGRDRSAWLEGTEQVVVGYQAWIPFFEQAGERAFADELRRRCALSHTEVLAHAILVKAGVAAVPNTDAAAPFQTFIDGWLARPADEPALNGTNWAYFGEVGYNPFTMRLEEAL